MGISLKHKLDLANPGAAVEYGGIGMKDYEALSKKHFDGQAAEYDQRDTYFSS